MCQAYQFLVQRLPRLTRAMPTVCPIQRVRHSIFLVQPVSSSLSVASSIACLVQREQSVTFVEPSGFLCCPETSLECVQLRGIQSTKYADYRVPILAHIQISCFLGQPQCNLVSIQPIFSYAGPIKAYNIYVSVSPRYCLVQSPSSFIWPSVCPEYFLSSLVVTQPESKLSYPIIDIVDIRSRAQICKYTSISLPSEPY